MKKIIILFLLVSTLFGQQIKVASIEKLNTNQDSFYPQFGADENEIFFTNSNFQGVYKFDLTSNSTSQINNDLSAGYEFVVADGSLIYRTEEIINNRRFFKYVEQNINSLSKSELTSLERDITSPRLIGGNVVKVNSQNEIENVKSFGNLQKSNKKEAIVANNKLFLIEGSEKRELNIFENGYYLWASVSPNQDKILFSYSGKGTFIIDLQGNILKELGSANFPSWSSDGKYIIYMNDKDDGHQVISSDIYLFNYQTEERINLTYSFNEIAMYPKVSESMNKIVFSNMNGDLYIINLISE